VLCAGALDEARWSGTVSRVVWFGFFRMIATPVVGEGMNSIEEHKCDLMHVNSFAIIAAKQSVSYVFLEGGKMVLPLNTAVTSHDHIASPPCPYLDSTLTART